MFHISNTISEEIKYFMEAIGDGIFIINHEGNITNCNKSACKMLGYSYPKQLENKPILNILEAIDDQGKIINKKNAALFKSINAGKKINNAIRQFKKKDGSRIWASITTTPLHTENDAKGAIIVIRDINEEKQQEEYRNNFSHIASHSLRTPLGNIMWAIEYLLSEKSGKLNDNQKSYIHDSYETLKNMNRLINDLLSISNMPYKKITPHWTKVNLMKIYEKVYNDLQYYAKARNLEIKIHTNQNEKLFVKADENHIRTIMQNIIENAARYAFPKTDINVEIKKEGKNILFSCTNLGIGIPKEKQKFIFAKFFRAGNAVNKEGGGTGLGLYITKELVDLNKGKIKFESEENKKTTFFIQFKKY